MPPLAGLGQLNAPQPDGPAPPPFVPDPSHPDEVPPGASEERRREGAGLGSLGAPIFLQYNPATSNKSQPPSPPAYSLCLRGPDLCNLGQPQSSALLTRPADNVCFPRSVPGSVPPGQNKLDLDRLFSFLPWLRKGMRLLD
ncbi:hypothetical protein HispidOSU_030403 [Sigmodon hispidus]